MSRLFAALLSAALLVTLASTLSGCPAELDWRELRSQEGGFSLYLPARVFEDARELAIAGQSVRMRQWSARARDTLFSVGYADFAPLQAEAFNALRDALVSNISGTILSERDLDEPSGVSREIVAAGHAGGAPLTLRLRLVASGERLYQIALLGKPDEVASGDIDLFFQSFKLLKLSDRSAPGAPQPGHPRR